MSFKRGDMARSVFGPPLTEEQIHTRQTYLYYFGVYPKQGRPTRDSQTNHVPSSLVDIGLHTRPTPPINSPFYKTLQTKPPIHTTSQHNQASLYTSSQQGTSFLHPLTPLKPPPTLPTHTSSQLHSTHEIRFSEATHDSLKLKSRVKDLFFNSNGQRLCVSTKESIVCVSPYTLGLETTVHVKAQHVLPHPNHPDVLAALSTDTYPTSIKLYDLRESTKSSQSKPFYEIVCQHGTLSHLAWHPNGSAIVCVDKGIRFASLSLPKSVVYPPKPTHHPSTSQDTSGAKKTVNFTDLHNTQAQQKITNIGYDGLGEMIILTHTDGTISLYPSEHLGSVFTEKIHTSTINCLTHSKDGQFIATGGNDHTVQLFDINDGVCKYVFPRLEGPVSCVATSWDGKLLAWGTKDSSNSTQVDDVLSYNKNREDTPMDKNEFFVCVAGVDPCELYFTHKTSFSLVACSFHPSRYMLAFACDVGGFNSKSYPIGLFSFE